MLRYLDEKTYLRNAGRSAHWKSHALRWGYHLRAVELVRSLGIESPKDVLELGTAGAAIVRGSDTMDFDGPWAIAGEEPTIRHDARIIPWPVATGRYGLFIALRVFHHLAPVQRECFLEARRIARRCLIVCPEQEVVGAGIHREQFMEWNGGEPAAIECDIPGGWGRLYLWEGEHGRA